MQSNLLSRKPNPPGLEMSDEIDLLKLWKALWRRKWAIIGFSMLPSLLVGLSLLTVTPTYRAETTVLIEGKPSSVGSIEHVYGRDTVSSEYLPTQLELFKSRALAERVVRQLNLVAHPEFFAKEQEGTFALLKKLLSALDIRKLVPSGAALEPPTPEELEVLRFDEVTRAFMTRIKVIRQGNSTLVKVQVEMSDPQMAAKAANALAKELIESQMEAAVEVSAGASAWMNGRLVSLREQLKVSEERLQRYREAENLVDVGGVSTISATELARTGDRLIDARLKYAEAESQYRQVQANRGNWEKLAAVPAVLGHPLIQQLKADETKARAKVEERSKRYGAQHPQMEAVRAELNAASASLHGQIVQVVAGIERNYQLAVANQKTLQASFNRVQSQQQSVSRKEFKLRELKSEVDANLSLYNAFANRLKETAATSDLDIVSVRIVDPAIVPTMPVGQRKVLVVTLTAMLCLILAAALTLLFEALNNTFKSADQVEEQLNIPVLGVAPRVSTKLGCELWQLYSRELDRRFSESIRTMRTGIVLGDLKQPHKVLLVTSSIPGEGKSTVSTNLACALGQMEKVLLIDADLRRPMLAKHFQLPIGSPGLANLLAGTASLDDCIQQADGVDVLAAGTVPPNPQELLASPLFSQLLEQLSERYQRIVIDTPPCLAVSDALLMSTLADFVLYVVKSYATAVPLVHKGIGQLLQGSAPVKGIVLNQVDVTAAGSRGGRYDGYYDYYSYSDSPT
ncbi:MULTISPECIES: polysaccharide biosynthesis tyrosine autokinase [unclassified Pseudomonas]|uniref:GumC family protein n=1 Tax=unclassified Pseudomonas TaxID=196821 RepID=UPI000C87E7D6|nr:MULTISPECIES: polysaccharide biosynthesis tyrosine autokinase [unclassified Pseudomonas]PMZ91436.1 lipopolysaccharide biosynthesis protein [Pseudomonas sp. FW215-T2]PNA14650.1 lipopolysaccharide biosynthesis protein [Pseudomonas sp. FW215-R3]PNB38628.1 lipopolysaccharide biosynthesis protein [Pseudomonas sp. FW305-131]